MSGCTAFCARNRIGKINETPCPGGARLGAAKRNALVTPPGLVSCESGDQDRENSTPEPCRASPVLFFGYTSGSGDGLAGLVRAGSLCPVATLRGADHLDFAGRSTHVCRGGGPGPSPRLFTQPPPESGLELAELVTHPASAELVSAMLPFSGAPNHDFMDIHYT